MKPDDLYWFFSTIAQTLGAIVAVVSMVCVYRFDALRNAKWAIMDKSTVLRRGTNWSDNLGQPAEDFLKWWKREGRLDESLTPEDHRDLNNVASRLEGVLSEYVDIKRNFIVFVVYNLVVILATLVVLPYSGDLSSSKDLVVPVTIVFVALSFILTGWLSYSLIPAKRNGNES